MSSAVSHGGQNTLVIEARLQTLQNLGRLKIVVQFAKSGLEIYTVVPLLLATAKTLRSGDGRAFWGRVLI